MSDVESEEDDPIDSIDFSVISTAIEAGGKTLDQILHAVHYGSPEVRHLLRESCDFIFECKYCRNLFRSIPNFIAHKRIYCGEKSFFPQNTKKKKPKQKEEIVTVRPVSPSLAVDTTLKEGEKTVLEQILTGSFQGNSDAYKVFTEAATNVEKDRINAPSKVVKTTTIKETPNAVNVAVLDTFDQAETSMTSNASEIIAKAKLSRKQPLTKIVDTLKKVAKSTKADIPKTATTSSTKARKTVTNLQKDTTCISSPKKTTDNRAGSAVEGKHVTVNVCEKTASNVASPRKNKTQMKTESTTTQKTLKDKVDNKSSEQKEEKMHISASTLKPAKVVLTALSEHLTSFNTTSVSKSGSSTQKSVTADTNKSQSAKEKTQILKPTTDLRPVKTHGTELSELSQLGHCDLEQLKCLICNLEYSQKKTLLQHMHVIHSGTKKKYPCNLCNKKFDYFWGLTRHILLIHKKTKEDIDRMRPELHALAYTVTSDGSEDKGPGDQSTQKQESSLRSSGGKQVTLVKVNTCSGCNKSFWKKCNYEEHAKQCRFLLAISSDNKNEKINKSVNNQKSTNDEEKEDDKEIVTVRRRRTLEKLAESRDKSSNNSNPISTKDLQTINNREQAAKKRLRVGGKFVSREAMAKMIKEDNKDKANAGRNIMVKKLKEKSISYVPTQRFISTRRSAAFYHSPAQRTRFHDKRRAVVSSPKKTSGSPVKSASPTKPCSESSTPSVSSEKKSPQQKSELEVARKNLINAIANVKKDQSPEKTLCPVQKDNGSKTPVNIKHPNLSLKKVDKEETSKQSIGEKVERMSRPTTRKQDNSAPKERLVDEMKKPNIKSEKNNPSRDSSVDSVRSRKSTRTQRDRSREVSVESNRSRQSSRSIESRLQSVKSSDSTSQKHHMTNRRSTSRDTSTESVRNSSKELNTTRKSHENQSREPSNESIRTRSSENLKDNVVKQKQESLGVTTLKNVSPESAKNVSSLRISPQSSRRSGSNISPESTETKNNAKGKTSPKEKKETISTGKDEIDGSQSLKIKPKWSTKHWDEKKSEKTKEGSAKADVSVKNKGNLSANKEKLKEVAKPKIVKRKPRYPTRSLRTRLQAAKKVGEIKKRYSIRVSKMSSETDNGNNDSENLKKIDKMSQLNESSKKRNTSPHTSPNDDKDIVETSEIKTKSSNNSEKNQVLYKQNQIDKSNKPNKTEVDAKSSKTVEKEEFKGKKDTSSEQKAAAIEDSKRRKSDVTYSHRPRKASDIEGVQVIEEIWVKKELGQPLQNVKVKKTIIDSPKNTKTGRIYVVDSAEPCPDKAKCLDFSRINHLVDYKNNKCLQCGIELTDISSLRRHAVRHLGWKRYKCKLCAYTGFNRSECNSHIKRRHAEKLITSSSPLSTFIIDLNKEGSNVRNKKKQSTIRRKNTAEQRSIKTKGKTNNEGKPIRNLRQSKAEEIEKTLIDNVEVKEESNKSENVENLPVRKSTRSNSGPPLATTSTETDDIETETKTTKKRKRAVSEEGTVSEIKGDDSSTSEIKLQSDSFSETSGNIDDLDEELRSVSDYEDNGDAPQRNVVSPSWTKVNPNVALMMATLEAARATKFSRGKKARGGIRRLSSPLKKHPRLSTDLSEQDQYSSKDDEEYDGQLTADKDGGSEVVEGQVRGLTEDNVNEIESGVSPEKTSDNISSGSNSYSASTSKKDSEESSPEKKESEKHNVASDKTDVKNSSVKEEECFIESKLPQLSQSPCSEKDNEKNMENKKSEDSKQEKDIKSVETVVKTEAKISEMKDEGCQT